VNLIFKILFSILLKWNLCAEAPTDIPFQKKNLVLIISSSQLPVFNVHRASWRKYMHKFSTDFECYFIEFDPELDQDYFVDGDILKIRGVESYIPGIFDKTVLALSYFEKRFSEFAFIVRPNLSSFIYFPALKKFLESQKKERFYSGSRSLYQNYQNNEGDHLFFGHGSCVVFSKDLAEVLVEKKGQYMQLPYSKFHADDLLFGIFFKKEGIPLVPFQSFYIEKNIDPYKIYSRIPDDTFHFRIKVSTGEDRLLKEKVIHNKLYEIFYE